MPATVSFVDKQTWTNRHENITQPVSGWFDIVNPQTASGISDIPSYNATTQALQSLIAKAIQQNKRLRAYGAGWSLTPVGVTDGYLINTRMLNFRFLVPNSFIAPGYGGDRTGLYFVQCGNAISELERLLPQNNRSIKTSGSSNGQTIVGALSTGTHGAALDFGAVQDFVVGLHLIVSPTHQVYLQRASSPVVGQAFADQLGAEFIQDDGLFNAALVSLGSFGIIHGVLIETDPLFLIEAHVVRLPDNTTLRAALKTLDFSALALPGGTDRPWHFEVVFNPNDTGSGPFVKVMYKRPYHPDYVPYKHDLNEAGLGDDALSVMGFLLEALPVGLTAGLFNSMATDEFTPWTGSPKFGTMGEIFSNETTRGTVLSSAMGVALADTGRALDAAFAAFQDFGGLFPGFISLRYVKGSPALLAPTGFGQTAMLELDGVYSDKAMAFANSVWNKLESEGIPYRFHWGKMNNLTAQRVQSSYGAALGQWRSGRAQLLDAAARQVFSSPFLDNLGLTS